MNPIRYKRLPIELLVVEIDHAATGYGRSGRVLQGEHFEDHLERLRQFNTLAIRQAQSFVVVQSRVQVFDPKRISRTFNYFILFFLTHQTQARLIHLYYYPQCIISLIKLLFRQSIRWLNCLQIQINNLLKLILGSRFSNLFI